MSDEQKQEVSQEVKQEVKQEVDLVTKVAGFQIEEKQEEHTQTDGITKFDYKDLNTITTPEQAKEWAEKAYKSMQGDYGKKTQAVAEKNRELERKMTESGNWTPQRIQELLNDQKFVAAAQSVMTSQNPPSSGKTDEEWSTLTDNEKSQILELKNEIAILKQQNMTASEKQQNEILKSRYANYDSSKISSFKQDLISGKIQATNEHLYKALYHDENVNKAYELGLKENRDLKAEKANASSYVPNSADVVRDPNLGKDLASLAAIYDNNKKQKTETQMR